MTLDRFIHVSVLAAIFCGAIRVLDGAIFDVVAESSAAAKMAGSISIAAAFIGVTGLYLQERSWRPCMHLDIGYLLNIVGLAGVMGITFSRNFILNELDDSVVDVLVENGPTVPALIVAGSLAGIGFVVFGLALVRHGFDAAGAWGYTILLPLSGFTEQMPTVPTALIETLGGLAIMRLGFVAFRRGSAPTQHPQQLSPADSPRR